MSYFLTNRIPTAAEAMRGFARGGEVEDERSYTPRGETLPVSPLAVAAQYDEKGNLIASPDSPLSKMGSDPTADWIKRMQTFGATPSIIPNLVNIGTGGKDIAAGDLFKTKKDQAIKSFEEQLKRVEAGGYLTPEVEKSLKDNLSYQLEQISAGESAYLNSLPQRQVLSDLLKNNQFSDAIKYAQDNGMQTLLTQPWELANLRQPFTKDEARQFMRSLTPEFFKSAYGDRYEYDKAWKFDPEGAEERGALTWVNPGGAGSSGPLMSETGYPMLERVLKPQEVKKDTGIFEKIFKGAAIAAAVFGGAQALSALSSAGAAGAGGAAGGAGAGAAGTAGAGGTGALTSLKTAATKVLGIPETIGKTVATALNFNASPVAAKMIGNAVISGGVTGAKGGDLEDVLKSAAMAAGLTYVSDKAISAVAQKLQDSRILEAARDIPGGDITAAAADPTLASTIADNMSQGIKEFTVSTFTPSAAAAGLQSVGAIGAAQQTVPGDRFAPEEDLLAGDITISTDGYDFGAGLETGAYTGYKLASDQGVGAEEPIETEEPVETVEVSAEGDELDLSNPLVQAVINQTPFEPEPIDPLTGQAEIEVTTAPEGVDMSDPLTQVLLNRYIDQLPPEPPVDDLEEFEIETERDLSPGVLQYAPPVGPSVSPDEILPDYEPTQVKSKWEELLSKYGTAENFFRLAGALAGGAAGKTSTGAAPTAPQYDPRATAKAGPWIDWEKVKAEADAAGMNLNTYTARNWNKIQNRAFEAAGAGTGEGGGAPAPFNPNINVMGGAPTGMAEGGRYVDGPGSGRDDKIPALLSDGEYVIDAETLALLGDGSTKEGARLMDDFRSNIRKHKGAALAKGGISPHAKSPLQYLRGR